MVVKSHVFCILLSIIFMQSHLSESLNEIAFVKSLHPEATTYAGVYDVNGLLHSGSIMVFRLQMRSHVVCVYMFQLLYSVLFGYTIFTNYRLKYTLHGTVWVYVLQGHSIHCSEEELALLKSTDTAVVNCASSNFLLGRLGGECDAM